jgi:pimeloyl-ACP methyl ester carboxylesterase
MPAAFNTVCRRSLPCRDAAHGSSWQRLVRLTKLLRSHPISGVAPGLTGARVHLRLGAVGFVNLLNDAAEDPQIYRGIDAAARAYLDRRDPAPLLRLGALRDTDEAYFGQPVSDYSVELYLAVACLDYPQLFDMHAPIPVRVMQFKAAEAALPASTFSPFTTQEWISQDQNTNTYSACLHWPRPKVAQPAVVAAAHLPRSIPVLVLGGELDTWTPPSGARKVLRQVGGRGRFIELDNATHVVGEGQVGCASLLVRRFVADPQAIDSLNAGCASRVTPIRAVGVYPGSLRAEPRLKRTAASTRSATDLRLAVAAVSTAGDALARFQVIWSCRDSGLYGGTVTDRRCGTTLVLHGDQLIPGVPVSGTVTLTGANHTDIDLNTDARITAKLTITRRGRPKASFDATWSTDGADALASVHGRVGRALVAGTTPAP